MANNERNAGRKPLPVNRKKLNYTVTLVPKEAKTLKERFGSLTLAIRSLIINQ